MKKSSRGSNLMILEMIFLLFIGFVYFASAAGDFNCTILGNQTCAFTKVIYLENDTGGYMNAHAQNIIGATFDYVICCNSNSSLSYGCGGVFLKLQGAYQFDKCMNITIYNAGSSTLANFPAYINLSYDNDMQPDFKDIRFYSGGCNNEGSELDYEIENYTASSRAHVWVRIPSLPSTGTTISIYYKNNTAISSGENPTGVWDSNYVGVWHMTEENAIDSTQYGNNGTEDGGVAFNASGRIDGSNSFTSDGHDYIDCGNDSSLNMGTGNLTLEGWIRLSDPTSQYRSIIGKTESANTYTYKLFTMNTNGWATVRIGNDTTFTNAYYELDLKDGQWHYIAGRVIRSVAMNVFLDGDKGADYPQNIDSTIDTSNPLYIGKDSNWGAGPMCNHTMDEIRISNIARSDDWINQSYQMVANQGSFVSFESEENGPGIWGGSHVQRGDYSGPGIIYGVSACLETTPGYFNCTYVDDACPSGRECFASMASSYPTDNNNTNAHIGPCNQYKRKICCRVATDLSVVYQNPTPANGTRRITNSAVINVSVTSDSQASVHTCILEWNGANETMQKVGTGSSVFCNKTKVTADGTTYYFKVYANDSNGMWGNESQRQFRENDEPSQVILLSPDSGSHFTNRTPTLKWNQANDADGDSLTYFVNITCLKLGGGNCASDNRYVSTGQLNYTPSSELQYFGDDNYYYNWSVKAWDSYENGTESEKWNFTIDTNVSISISPDVVDFGEERQLGYQNDTSDDAPNPFGLHNDANCIIDANISAIDSLWVSVGIPSNYFNYSVDWFSGEIGAFNWSGSTTSWTNVPLVNNTFIDSLNYKDTNDSAEIEIQIMVPWDEPAGGKSSTIIFTGWYIGET